MIVYLDASTVMRLLLNQQGPTLEWETWEHAFTSELLRVEAIRTFERLSLISPRESTSFAER